MTDRLISEQKVLKKLSTIRRDGVYVRLNDVIAVLGNVPTENLVDCDKCEYKERKDASNG